ncbi:MAG: hypothetical protein ABIN18_28105 [Pseudomonadota bacterium]
MVGALVWNSDWFQREYFPKEYWSEQVNLYEDEVSMDRYLVRDAAIELKKLQMTAKLQVAQEINLAKSLGLSTEEARKEAVEMIKVEIQDLRDDIAMWKDMLKKDQEELEKARSRLSRYE